MSFIRTHRALHCSCLALAVAIAGVSPAFADGHLPSADEIFAKYTEAVGGADAFAKLKNQVSESTFALPDMGMDGPMVDIVAPPNSRSTITFEGFGEFDNGVTDGVAWVVDPMEGSRVLEGDEAVVAVASVGIDPFVNFKGEAKTVGEEKIGDEDCYKVDVTGVGSAHFSKASGLLVMSDSAQGPATMSDWKEVDGILIAHKITIEADMNFEVTINSVQHNVDIADDAFALPSEIQALLPQEAASEGMTAAQVMAMMDANSDGKITLEEAPEQLSAAFGMVDMDASGGIDLSEAQMIADFMNNQ